MFDISKATNLARQAFPDGKIQAHIEYENLFIFMIFSDSPGEEFYDPFYSFNRDTGEFRDFSIYTDGDTKEITRLFEDREAKSSNPRRR